MTSTVAAAASATPGASPSGDDARTACGDLRRSQLWGYASGDAANQLTFSMSAMFLLIYYTDVVGISAAAAGTLFLVVRVARPRRTASATSPASSRRSSSPSAWSSCWPTL